MLGILHHICEFLLSALKRYSPGRLLQYFLALCRAVFSRSKSDCSGQDWSHEPLSKTPTLAEGKESLSEEGIVTPVGHVISGSCTPSQMEASPSTGIPLSNVRSEPPLRQDMCITSKPPLKEGLHYMWTKSHSLFNMVTLLDYPGFVHRSLAHTQIKEDDVYSTDVEKWREFSRIYADNIQYISLLATVLLAANMSFLAIASIDQAPHGISYLPQRFSYWSLLSALTSIVMGSAVHSPRLFTNHGQFYAQSMSIILGFPFECFAYSVLFFLLALLIHCAKHDAKFQLIFAAVLSGILLCCLVVYWLITEPCNDIDSLEHRFVTVTGERRATTTAN